MIHLKDFIRLPGGHLCPAACGEGSMDWESLLAGMRDFEGPVLFEYENCADVRMGSEKCMRFVKGILEKEKRT